MNDGWHDESAENAVVYLDGSIEYIASEKKKVITVEDSGCAWMAPTLPPVAPLAASAVAEFVAVEGF